MYAFMIFFHGWMYILHLVCVYIYVYIYITIVRCRPCSFCWCESPFHD